MVCVVLAAVPPAITLYGREPTDPGAAWFVAVVVKQEDAANDDQLQETFDYAANTAVEAVEHSGKVIRSSMDG